MAMVTVPPQKSEPEKGPMLSFDKDVNPLWFAKNELWGNADGAHRILLDHDKIGLATLKQNVDDLLYGKNTNLDLDPTMLDFSHHSFADKQYRARAFEVLFEGYKNAPAAEANTYRTAIALLFRAETIQIVKEGMKPGTTQTFESFKSAQDGRGFIQDALNYAKETYDAANPNPGAAKSEKAPVEQKAKDKPDTQKGDTKTDEKQTAAKPHHASATFEHGEHQVKAGDTLYQIALDNKEQLAKVQAALGKDVSKKDAALALSVIMARASGISDVDRIEKDKTVITLPSDAQIKQGLSSLKIGMLADNKIDYPAEMRGHSVDQLVALEAVSPNTQTQLLADNSKGKGK